MSARGAVVAVWGAAARGAREGWIEALGEVLAELRGFRCFDPRRERARRWLERTIVAELGRRG